MFRYCGEYFDKETGTIYLRARYYDPTIGRFITEDSYWGKDNDPLSLNLYTYCYSNPINRFDPSGHRAELGFYEYSYEGYIWDKILWLEAIKVYKVDTMVDMYTTVANKTLEGYKSGPGGLI